MLDSFCTSIPIFCASFWDPVIWKIFDPSGLSLGSCCRSHSYLMVYVSYYWSKTLLTLLTSFMGLAKFPTPKSRNRHFLIPGKQEMLFLQLFGTLLSLRRHPQQPARLLSHGSQFCQDHWLWILANFFNPLDRFFNPKAVLNQNWLFFCDSWPGIYHNSVIKDSHRSPKFICDITGTIFSCLISSGLNIKALSILCFH